MHALTPFLSTRWTFTRATPPPSAPSPATAMSSDTTISVEEFTALCKLNQQLHSMMRTPVPGAESNGTSSASIFLCTQFPDVNVVVIMAIIMHEFKAMDLHKLNPTNCDKEMVYMFNSATNRFEMSHRAAKEYKTPFSVIIPLQFYFNILMFHVNNAAAMSAFFHYTAYLVKLISEYEWSVVYDYHSVFFNWQRAEMAAGDYL
ncbi:hypothetical protein C0995_002601 [Termitomyces sp. Mi166|nr:hypothetical protein C0995_002601 [Termitomyces sp. Mi166\